jgi:type I restriction enzyme S subunit
MSSDWEYAPLGEVCSRITYGFTNPMPTVDGDGAYMVTAKDIKNGRIQYQTARKTSWYAYRSNLTDKSRPAKGDLLLTKDGSIGRLALCDRDDICINQSVALLQSNGKGDFRYIKYLLEAPEYQRKMESDSDGSTIKHIYITRVDKMIIPLPPRKEQQGIVSILGTLDDKIELNRKTNETLEAMAKALFKSWFVDFDPVKAKAEGRPTGLPAEISDLFPDSFDDSELGEIPSGWECCSFTQLVEVISGGTPKTSVDEYWNGSVNWFSVVDAPSSSDCWVIQTEKSITHQGLNNCSSKLLSTGTTIISARGTVGKVCLAGQDMAMNQSCYGLRSKAENGGFFCFYLTKSLVEILEARAHGSVFSTITRDTLDGVSTISPSLEVIQSFNGIAGALLGKIKNNLEDNRILGNQRDALLPKLISGEIRIPDVEKMLEEVGV